MIPGCPLPTCLIYTLYRTRAESGLLKSSVFIYLVQLHVQYSIGGICKSYSVGTDVYRNAWHGVYRTDFVLGGCYTFDVFIIHIAKGTIEVNQKKKSVSFVGSTCVNQLSDIRESIPVPTEVNSGSEQIKSLNQHRSGPMDPTRFRNSISRSLTVYMSEYLTSMIDSSISHYNNTFMIHRLMIAGPYYNYRFRHLMLSNQTFTFNHFHTY